MDHITKVKCQTVKPLEENMAENLHDIRVGNKCLTITPMAFVKEKKVMDTRYWKPGFSLLQ